jgi:hypothetical protein
MDYLEVQAAMDTIHRIKTSKAKNKNRENRWATGTPQSKQETETLFDIPP